jgi:hypothetical protein
VAARVFLAATAIVFLAFGLWGAADPAGMLTRFNVEVASGDGRTAIRAMYGGFLLGAGALFLFCAADTRRVTFGLQAVLLITGPILAARLFGMSRDGATAYHISYATLEVVGILASAAFLRRGARNAA